MFVQEDMIRLGINPEHVLKRLKPLAKAKIISLEEIQSACAQKTFNQFIQRIERPWRWKTHLSQSLSLIQTRRILGYLHANLQVWQEVAEKRGRIFIDTTPEIRFCFEYDPQGTIWLHNSFWHLDNALLLATDLDQGTVYQVAEFPDEIAARISKYRPYFKKTVGLICFEDFVPLDCPTKQGPVRKVFAKHALFDTTLDKAKIPPSLSERVKIAVDLLKGLLALEEDKIIHTAVFPSDIHICYQGTAVRAALGRAEFAYFRDALPAKLVASSLKWKEWMPPECEETTDKLTHPQAISIYQLGRCLNPFFDPASPPGQIVAKMILANPEERLTAEQALQAFDEDFKEPALQLQDEPDSAALSPLSSDPQ